MPQKLPFLHVEKTKIVNEYGKSVVLRGVALGGWLNMEGYMMCGRNIPERDFKANLARAAGVPAVEDFTRSFRGTFITEHDIKIIKDWGANCIRVPFNYRLLEFEDRPYSLNAEGLGYLDNVVRWCEKHRIYCILDLHAAPGAQNEDWHADCSGGKPEFFTNDVNKDRFLRLWRFIAAHYKDASAVAGYDVLNEPVVAFDKEDMVKDIYDRVTKEIRDEDKKHIIFLEGNHWAQRLNFLGKPKDPNTVYSIHAYPPTEFVFNYINDLVYPCKVNKIMWNKNTLNMLAGQYFDFIRSNEVPLYVGEFGVNWRGGGFGELKWTKDMLSIMEEHDMHWTYWTYKTVANSTFPDGIYRYVENPPWVNRKGPVTGWENFYSLWPKEKDNIIASWRTEHFRLNSELCSLLKRHF